MGQGTAHGLEPLGLPWPNQSTGPSSLPFPAMPSPLPRQVDGQAACSTGQGSKDPHTLQGAWGRGCIEPHTAGASPGVRGAVLRSLDVPHLLALMGQYTHQARANTRVS